MLRSETRPVTLMPAPNSLRAYLNFGVIVMLMDDGDEEVLITHLSREEVFLIDEYVFVTEQVYKELGIGLLPLEGSAPEAVEKMCELLKVAHAFRREIFLGYVRELCEHPGSCREIEPFVAIGLEEWRRAGKLSLRVDAAA